MKIPSDDLAQRIMLICPNYPPEPAPSGVMAQQLARRITAAGHTVTAIVQFPSRPCGRIYPGYASRLRSLEFDREVRVVRSGTWPIGPARRPLNRVLENLTFGLTAVFNAIREPKPHVLIIETWPLIAVQLALLLAWFWRVPSIYYIKDVYPEAAEELGFIQKGGLVARILRRWDRFLCLHSSKVVVISDTMRELIISRGVESDRVIIIRDWVDGAQFPVRPKGNPWRCRMRIPQSCFVAIFAGTIGLVSGADVLLETAEALQAEDGLLLLCVGEGPLKKTMTEKAARKGYANLRFEGFQPQELIADMHGTADVLLLTMRANRSDSSVPSKLISYLAAGRPIICSAQRHSAVAEIVRQAHAGIVVPPEDGKAIAGAILRLAHDPAEAKQMGANARRHFEEHFTSERAFRQFSDLFAGLLERRGGDAPNHRS